MATQDGARFGSYTILRRLGGGGAGEVYLAEGPGGAGQSTPGQVPGQVALKILRASADDAQARELARQAQAVGALHQSHVLPFYGVVQHEGRLGLAMAYAQGGSLGDTLREQGGAALTLPLGVGVVARLVDQLARALAATHAAGVVHGDLKPNNIFVRTSPGGGPIAAIGDFGQGMVTAAAVAVASRPDAARAEQAEWATRQLAFAAPEQLRGQATPATDQYALAAVAYLLLTGRAPFTGDLRSLPQAVAQQAPAPPTQFNADLSPEAESALLRALSKRPEARFESVEAFAQALGDALAASIGARSGVTQQLSRLSLQAAGAGRPERATTADGGLRIYDRTGELGSGATRGAAASAALPQDVPARANRRLMTVAAAALLLVILACALGTRSFESGGVLSHLTGGASGVTSAPTPTANATATAQAHDAEGLFAQATAGAPVFSDDLSANAKKWPTDGKTTFFARDGLHVAAKSLADIAGTDAPTGATDDATSVAMRVDMTLAHGTVSDLAGIRFFTDTVDGQPAYFAFLVSSEGRYEVRLRHNGIWEVLATGYGASLKPGFNQTNTLGVLARSAQYQILLFANGHYIATVTTPHQQGLRGPTSGGSGVLVINDGAEAVYSHYAVYTR